MRTPKTTEIVVVPIAPVEPEDPFADITLAEIKTEDPVTTVVDAARPPRKPKKSKKLATKRTKSRSGGKRAVRRRAQREGGPGKRRFHPGTVALREIRSMQRNTDHVFSRAPFRRLIQEVVQDVGGEDMRVSGLASHAIQEAAESFLTAMLEESNLAALHANRTTIIPKDMRFVQRMHAGKGIPNPER